MSKLGWVVGVGAVWSIVLACSERDLPLGRGPEDAGEGAGASPTGGRSAEGGGSGAGRGNRAGAGGDAGRASDGGQANGARSGGGIGGRLGEGAVGGECEDRQGPVLTFPQCELPVLTMGGSTCTLAETQQALHCGQPESNLDASCCPRPTCRDDAECGEDSVCIPRVVQHFEIGGSIVESCEVSCASCGCSITEDIDSAGYCVGVDEGLSRFDCDTSGKTCEELSSWRWALEEFSWWSQDLFASWDSFARRSAACAEKLDLELAESCGAGGECACEDDECTLPLEDFHPFSALLGRTPRLDELQAMPLLCGDVDFIHYARCDDETGRFTIQQGSENLYVLGFDSTRGTLAYGTAQGPTTGICSESESASISAGSALEPRTCESCDYCAAVSGAEGQGGAGDGGAGGSSGLPDCGISQFGQPFVR